ncbi:hypothetical protein QO034_12370 [Sedimentitalea sp. JM2-8]|uniref:Tripartite tricarboxylate transporter TctB family protein n=1 Tax=Sedimentitalea xiamensis TaxID=3050037 RepID=A0ABT7FG26_9RHOB|nr:hypothetical protein [Sedimentitalea xiamensis]MDK3073908.1 hypothetical protein [Sedimentitalea xiamensis]
MLSRRNEVWIALLCIVAALVTAMVWVPLDSETPPIYTFRRQINIGDAMLPLVSATGIAICAVIHLLLTLRREPATERSAPLDIHTGSFFLPFAAIMLVSCMLMYWAGPIALALFGPTGEEAVTYRQMRAAFPWKYIGYGLGGFTMVFGVTSLIEGRISASRALTSMLAVLALILVFDVPFDTILLPPNGDY